MTSRLLLPATPGKYGPANGPSPESDPLAFDTPRRRASLRMTRVGARDLRSDRSPEPSPPRSRRMRVPFVRLSLAALAAAWLASPAYGQTTLTSGNATFTLKAPPTGESSATYSDVALRPDGGTNHLWSQWLFYRVAGDTRERPFGNYTKTGGGSVSMS